jgi:proteasome lid subunit RPN8/RPN11
MIKIPQSVLELFLHAARSAYPNEFGAMIRGEGDTVKELLLLPGTVQGRKFASFRMNMLPIDSRAIGVAHSHPSGSYHPSEQDLVMFSKVGHINLIARAPFRAVEDVACYDGGGNRQEIEIIA